VETTNIGKKMSKSVNVEVSLAEVGGNQTRLIKKFIKKVKKERIIEDYLERSRYVKPSAKRRRKKILRKETARKLEKKRREKQKIKY
tara:strand:+ start:208 stop:468 length:261 start_codon:yes stop_codon:yes gene_type:complete